MTITARRSPTSALLLRKWEYTRFNQFKNVSYKESSMQLLNVGESYKTYAKAVTAEADIKYDTGNRPVYERSTTTIVQGRFIGNG